MTKGTLDIVRMYGAQNGDAVRIRISDHEEGRIVQAELSLVDFAKAVMGTGAIPLEITGRLRGPPLDDSKRPPAVVLRSLTDEERSLLKALWSGVVTTDNDTAPQRVLINLGLAGRVPRPAGLGQSAGAGCIRISAAGVRLIEENQ